MVVALNTDRQTQAVRQAGRQAAAAVYLIVIIVL
jgi:hypothetical protein